MLRRIKKITVIGCALLGVVVSGQQYASAALAKASGGSGYSGKLSSNKGVRQQQLICDPATTQPSGEPISGSTSVTYNPAVVSLSGLSFGPGYTGTGEVEESVIGDTGNYLVLQSISSFLSEPEGVQTGYVQVSYSLSGSTGAIVPPSGFNTYSSAGVAGADTHALMFTYLSTVADSAAAAYTVYADTGNRASGNSADFLTGVNADGSTFTLGPSQLAPATVSASLDAPIPLPSAALTGAGMLTLIAGYFAFARRAAV